MNVFPRDDCVRNKHQEDLWILRGVMEDTISATHG